MIIKEQLNYNNDIHITPEKFIYFLENLFEWNGIEMREWFKKHFKLSTIKRIVVLGNLDLSGTRVQTLPDNLVIRGDRKSVV